MNTPQRPHGPLRKVLLSGEKNQALADCMRQKGFIPHYVSETHLLHAILQDGPFDFLCVPGTFMYLVALFLEGIPASAWIIDRQRRILIQNRAAERDWKTKAGDFCFLAIHGGLALPENDRELALAGKVHSGMKCIFCRTDEALAKGETVRAEIEWQERAFDVF